MSRLQSSTLVALSDDVLQPRYDRASLKPGILHFGMGAFHRAHQAVYTDEAVALAGGDWGIIGVSLTSNKVAQQLLPQDCLYSVLSQDSEQTEKRVIGVVQDVIVAPEHPERVASLIADPRIKIISLTITEKGYCLAGDGHSLDRNNESIKADLENPNTPRSAIGLLALGLHQRSTKVGAPITLLSCDNLSENSTRLKGVLIDYLSSTFPQTIEWLNDTVSFPCSMVDRIVPAMTTERIQRQAFLLGIDDNAAVQTERFSQWIVEDQFAAGRPAWERTGVEFVQDILPYEDIKLRLLNASHTAIAQCGLLQQLETVADVMNDADLSRFILQLMNEELIPALDMPKNFDIAHYRDQLLQRFRNPYLQHRCAQIAMDSSEKISQRWLTSLNRSAPSRLVKVLSAWCYLILHTDIDIDDPRKQQLGSLRGSAEPMPERVNKLLACARIDPGTIKDFEQLSKKVVLHIACIDEQGLPGLLRS